MERDRFLSLYHFEGRLVLERALHIGSSRTTSNAATDSPVVRDFYGRPYIPGSTLRGVFRSAVEKLLRGLPLAGSPICGGPPGCIQAEEANKKAYAKIKIIPTQAIRERKLRELLEQHLCLCCRVFGCIDFASRVFFSDASLSGPFAAFALTEVRDGVAIDRDRETAADQRKFDYEVVPPGMSFTFELTAENLSSTAGELSVLAIGLQELLQGNLHLGGKRAGGLGKVRLIPEPVRFFDTAKPQAGRSPEEEILRYLTHGGRLTREKALGDFITEEIGVLCKKWIKAKGPTNAEAATE